MEVIEQVVETIKYILKLLRLLCEWLMPILTVLDFLGLLDEPKQKLKNKLKKKSPKRRKRKK